MLRLLLIVVVLALGAMFIEPSVDPGSRSVTLRLRAPAELVGVAQRELARVAGSAGESAERAEPAQPAVGAPARRATPVVPKGPPPERLTRAERARLDKLVEETTRGK
jgi:hypothetical protein